ncbi:MAG: SPOR domain-containing protein [Gemmatimonadaceae bacterium]
MRSHNMLARSERPGVCASLGAKALIVMRPSTLDRTSVATLALVLLIGVAPNVQGQNSDARVARVKRLVNAGERAAAKQLADSMVVTYPEGSNEYADALYARAISSASAVDAERDYLRISIEYTLSPRAQDALLMVAQLRMARGDRAGARRNYERLARDYPTGEQTARASYWAGRLALDDGDGVRACPALQRAQQLVSEDDVELKNQIDYYVQRCSAPGALATRDTTTTTTVSPASTSVPQPAVVPPAKRDSPPPRTTASTRADARRDSAVRENIVRDSVVRAAARRDSIARVSGALEAAASDSTQRDSAAHVAMPNVKTARQGPPPREAVPPVANAVAAHVVPAKAWSVQVASFPKARDAKALSEVLEQRGFSVRVFGEKPPYRVRVGRYATREDAAAALGRMKAKRLNGMVVVAEPQ